MAHHAADVGVFASEREGRNRSLAFALSPPEQIKHRLPLHVRANAVRVIGSAVAGLVSLLLCTVMSVNFGLLVFAPVPGGAIIGIQMAIVGVGVLGNGALSLFSGMPCMVATVDNGVMAPLVAEAVVGLAREIHDHEALLASSIAIVALAAAIFGFVQLVAVQLPLMRLVQYLPYSIPMGFLSGIGLELCFAIDLAGPPAAQAVAFTFALVLCWGSWVRQWPLSVLFPVLLGVSVGSFYLLGGPESWLLDIGANDSQRSMPMLWSPKTFNAIQWSTIFRVGHVPLIVICLLGGLQNCLFAEIYVRALGAKAEITSDDVLVEFGQIYMVGGCVGFAGGFYNMACFSLSKELHSYPKAPSCIVAVLSAAIAVTGIAPVLRMPRFIFAGLLLWVGLKFLRAYLVQPAGMLPRSETAVIVIVAAVMKIGGFSAGLLLGLALALVDAVGKLAALSCVQRSSTSSSMRSNVIRSVLKEKILFQHGRQVLVLRLAPGFVFFATAADILRIIENKLREVVEEPVAFPTPASSSSGSVSDMSSLADSEVCSHSDVSDSDGPAIPTYQSEKSAGVLTTVVIDFTLCRGFDGSLVDVLQQVTTLGTRYEFNLRLAGLQPDQRHWLEANMCTQLCTFFADLDRALEDAENELLSNFPDRDLEKQAVSMAMAGRCRRLSSDYSVACEVFKPIAAGPDTSSSWQLLFLYSDSSAVSRSMRPLVSQVMAILERKCELYEASADACPDLAAQIGTVPAIALMRGGRLFARLDGQHRVQEAKGGSIGAAVLPGAAEIARDAENHIRLAGSMGDLPTLLVASHDKVSHLNPTSPTKRKLTEWQRFLRFAGVQEDGPLAALEKHVSGPQVFEPGEVLIYKGSTPKGVFFVLEGALSLWNERPDHPMTAAAPQHKIPRRKSSKQGADPMKMAGAEGNPVGLQEELLSTATSRLLKMGPGWVLGEQFSRESGIRPPVSLFTCAVDVHTKAFELSSATLRTIQKEDPGLALLVNQLLHHFSGVVLEHLSTQLGDWHALLFSPSNVGTSSGQSSETGTPFLSRQTSEDLIARQARRLGRR